MDDFLEYLYVTGQLDDINEEDTLDNDEEEEEEEDSYRKIKRR